MSKKRRSKRKDHEPIQEKVEIEESPLFAREYLLDPLNPINQSGYTIWWLFMLIPASYMMIAAPDWSDQTNWIVYISCAVLAICNLLLVMLALIKTDNKSRNPEFIRTIIYIACVFSIGSIFQFLPEHYRSESISRSVIAASWAFCVLASAGYAWDAFHHFAFSFKAIGFSNLIGFVAIIGLCLGNLPSLFYLTLNPLLANLLNKDALTSVGLYLYSSLSIGICIVLLVVYRKMLLRFEDTIDS